MRNSWEIRKTPTPDLAECMRSYVFSFLLFLWRGVFLGSKISAFVNGRQNPAGALCRRDECEREKAGPK